MSWTEERVERLKKLWSDGLSASQIAAELGEVTRNAVIGKVHRLGLSGRVKTTNPAQGRPRKTRRSTTVAPPTSRISSPRTVGATALKVDLVPVIAENIQPVSASITELKVSREEGKSILELTEYTCKWPIGDPGNSDFYFCGRNSDEGRPYCEHHSQVAYQPSFDKRRDKRNVR